MLKRGLVLISIMLILFSACSDEETPSIPLPTPTTSTWGTPTPDIGNQSVIENIYAPILYFDAKEKDYITSVDRFIYTGVKLQGRVKSNKYVTILDNVNVDDLAKYNSPRMTFENNEVELMIQSDSKVSNFDDVVYTRKTDDGSFIYLQYWFFYSYNDTSGIGGNSLIQKCGNHQGDWEHISLKLDKNKLSKASNDKDYLNAIYEMYFSQHNKGQNDNRKFKKPNDPEVSFENTHIKVYPARGTHASYYQPHKGEGYPLSTILFYKLYDKADGKGDVFKTQGKTQDIMSKSWVRFGGKWGEISDDICNIAEWFSDASNDGPIGPTFQNTGIDW